MPGTDLLRYGILKSRDLVELYFGGRMVANVRETNFLITTTTPTRILTQDPARISYEIIVAAGSGIIDYNLSLATSFDAALAGTGIVIRSAYPQTSRIKRTFFEDLDSVGLGLWANALSGGATTQTSVREVYLTPAPVDEIPLG